MNIWAFWEPESTMPVYLKLCVETWKIISGAEIHLLNYRNLWKYIDIDAYGPKLFAAGFPMAQVGDAIRAMLLEKHTAQGGGDLWLDVDTIITNSAAEKLLTAEKDIRMFGDREKKHCHISCISTKRPGTNCMIEWVAHNKRKIWNVKIGEPISWGLIGGDFLEPYAYSHPQEVEILDWHLVHPEEQLRRHEAGEDYRRVYEDYFFGESHHLNEIDKDVIILNNTWTPDVIKKMSLEDLLQLDCTAVNLLVEILGIKRPPPKYRMTINR